MKDQELKNKIDSISNSDLVKKAQSILNQLCKTGGNSFIMCVPPQIDDTDIIFSELINRFEKLDIRLEKLLDKTWDML